MKWICFLILTTFCSCTILQSNTMLYHASKALSDTAFVYALPYEKGKSYRVVQGYHSFFSHYDDIALDFKMRRGTKVCAARDGVVMLVNVAGTEGGIGKKYVGKANHIAIRHSDSTYAHYVHLQHNGALVQVGDSVRQGQVIGFSGSTGFSAFPHLHFEVTEGPRKAVRQVPVRFHTNRGSVFLQPLRRYKAN